MSVFTKDRGDRSYVYFQLYGGKRRKVVYLGLGNQLSTWEKAERHMLEYLDRRLTDFYAQVPDELRNRIHPKEGSRRLLEERKELTQLSSQRQQLPLLATVKSRPSFAPEKEGLGR